MRVRQHLTYANAMATAAVFIALGGGAYAVTVAKKNSVTSKSVKNDSLQGVDINESTLDLSSGEPGPQGPKGDKGDTGAAPTCQGNSADDVMVQVGTTCVDRYEASIWTAKTGGTQITGAIPCNANGQDCQGVIFARSVAGVAPRASITYFQAQQALANSGKRLLTNAEWQTAVAGTPDTGGADNGTGDCNTDSTFAVANTGSRAGCISDWGVNDMVGNLWEWVGDWDEQADDCASWPGGFGSDFTCFGDGTPSRFPGALIRGGSFDVGTFAGPFAVNAFPQPSNSGNGIGFRGSR